MKIRNAHFYGDAERLKQLKADYDYSARNVTRMVAPDHLVVLALPPKRKAKKDSEEVERQSRRTNGYGRGGKR